MISAAATTFCNGKRRASNQTDIRLAKKKKLPSKALQGDVSGRRASHATDNPNTTKSTIHAARTCTSAGLQCRGADDREGLVIGDKRRWACCSGTAAFYLRLSAERKQKVQNALSLGQGEGVAREVKIDLRCGYFCSRKYMAPAPTGTVAWLFCEATGVQVVAGRFGEE